MKSVIKLLQDLVALPSVNPAFLPANDRYTGEDRVADYLVAQAARAGVSAERQSIGQGRFNLVARLDPKGSIRHSVLLAPHLDTVGAPEISPDLFIPRLKGGRLHGRGACDTKGSVAAMFSAFLQLAKGGRRPEHTEVIFLGLADEEFGQAGSHAWARTGSKADLAIVGEPTSLQVVTAHKGDVWLRLETHGKSAHGAHPELGRNAIHLMAKAVDLLETAYAQALKKQRHPLLGHPTINVGTIAGGTQPNVVPDRCHITIDRRTLPGEDERSVTRELRTLFRRHGIKARLASHRQQPCPPLETDPKRPLVRALLQAAGRTRVRGVDFFCDAAILSGGGTPSVVFGPGDIAQAHTADEWISVRSLELGAARFGHFLESLP